MARNKKQWFRMRSRKAGKKTAKRLKANHEVLKNL